MNRRNFLRALTLMFAAWLAGWRPKVARAAIAPAPTRPTLDDDYVLLTGQTDALFTAAIRPLPPIPSMIACQGSYRMMPGYTGPLMRYRTRDGELVDHYEGSAMPDGAEHVITYDQSGNGNHMHAFGGPNNMDSFHWSQKDYETKRDALFARIERSTWKD